MIDNTGDKNVVMVAKELETKKAEVKSMLASFNKYSEFISAGSKVVFLSAFLVAAYVAIWGDLKQAPDTSKQNALATGVSVAVMKNEACKSYNDLALAAEGEANEHFGYALP